MPLPPSEPPIDPSPQDTAKPSAPGVTLLVPAFNEENGIEGVVRRLAALDLGVPTEVLVVEDGSSDGTAAKLEQLQKEIPSLRVLKHGANRGYGASLKTGFESARTDVVVITDADDTYPEDRIAELIAQVDDGADMAVGARIGAQVKIPLIRRPAKAALRMLASYLAGVRIPDLNSGLRAIRRDVVLKYKGILPQGFSFTTTITLACLTNNHRVDYVTIDYAARTGSSKIRPIRDTLGFTALIIRTVLYFNPLKVFYPMAAVIALGLVGSLYYDLFVEDPRNLGDKTVLMFVALVQVLSIGLTADLIDKKSRLR
ncbi:MAG: glycosyltransferase family 2 protein [Planctomycetota bacterium]|nr:glycosyltransferase family 2 protein [Planctomycetota bacterium]